MEQRRKNRGLARAGLNTTNLAWYAFGTSETTEPMSNHESFGVHGGLYQNNFSEVETNQFTIEFSEITKSFAEAMAEGVQPSEDRVQELVKKHYDFVSKFWTPTKDAYKSLAMSYILPSPYKDSYEAVSKGLGKYHYDAIVIWSEKNL